MDDDYYSIDAILAENQVQYSYRNRFIWLILRHAMQKIQCKFKRDIPDMGHLDGGSERDVRVHRHFAARGAEGSVW